MKQAASQKLKLRIENADDVVLEWYAYWQFYVEDREEKVHN